MGPRIRKGDEPSVSPANAGAHFEPPALASTARGLTASAPGEDRVRFSAEYLLPSPRNQQWVPASLGPCHSHVQWRCRATAQRATW